MVPIAEYSTLWEANVAAARLRESGFEAVVLSDPATEVAPHHVTERLAVLMVREEAEAATRDVLGLDQPDHEAELLDAAFHLHRFADRPAWVRYATWALLIAIPGPIAVLALWLALSLVQNLFP